MKKLLKGLIIAALAALSIMAALDFGWRTEKESQDALMALSGSALCGRIEEITEDYIIEPVKEEADLPPAYDYRENGRSVPVRDQGQYGTCWAFASLTALETSLMPDALYDFSRDHLNFHNHYQMETEEGGSYILSVSYLTAWEGPVLKRMIHMAIMLHRTAWSRCCMCRRCACLETGILRRSSRLSIFMAAWKALSIWIFPIRGRIRPIMTGETPATAIQAGQNQTMMW